MERAELLCDGASRWQLLTLDCSTMASRSRPMMERRQNTVYQLKSNMLLLNSSSFSTGRYFRDSELWGIPKTFNVAGGNDEFVGFVFTKTLNYLFVCGPSGSNCCQNPNTNPLPRAGRVPPPRQHPQLLPAAARSPPVPP